VAGGAAVAAGVLWATLASLPLGIFVAYALARWEFPGKQVLNGLVHLPLILPPVVTGYLLLLVTFGRRGRSGSSSTSGSASCSPSAGRARRWRRRSWPFR
jgi:ABC-type molybdate transport system permease subunit